MNNDFSKIARAIFHGASLAFRIGLYSRVDSEAHGCYRRSRDPVVGDLVVEISTFGDRDHLDRVGWLVSHEDCRFVIRTLDGRELSWENCDFITAPTEHIPTP